MPATSAKLFPAILRRLYRVIVFAYYYYREQHDAFEVSARGGGRRDETGAPGNSRRNDGLRCKPSPSLALLVAMRAFTAHRKSTTGISASSGFAS